MALEKTTLLGGVGASTSFLSVVAVNLVRLTQWFELVILCIGGLTAIMSIYWMHRINRIALTKEELALCEQCQRGREPAVCPIPRAMRPKNCPKNKHKKS